VASFSVFTSRRGLPAGQGGFCALMWPVALILTAMVAMGGTAVTVSEPSGPVLGGLLLLISAPTTWLFALFRLSPTVAVVLGIVTSLPLWFRLGSGLARSSLTWGQWWRRYALTAIGSMVAILLIVAIAASFTS
jgi:hypothetical protein